ncbi:alpha/beta hydrolase [Chitinophaga silvatica]|uniref:Alpha/beta hydrolase n=1 Tax=Chitinophaga silvatica TaxID=2282649 RepID=A0A3E1YG62_9BACT|nr:alpha/beta hydrolase-fold protein [Chitinophaga silvatica]RFS26356.1 alpha/beta hydrolase [Chitinophaga silvatica]
MKKILLAICLLAPAFLLAQSAVKPLIAYGRPDSIYSTILQENRPLFIYTPPLDTPYFSQARYPVLYVLDGDQHFELLHAMMQELIFNDITALPKMIIVGIANTPNNRTKDLTSFKDKMSSRSGGGQNFISFLEKELIPYINKQYSTAPYNVLIGHSLGGLMATDVMLHQSKLFNAYLAIDPSLFWSQRATLKNIQYSGLANKKYYLAIAHTMEPDLDSITVRKDTSQTSVHINAMLSFVDSLKSKAPGSLKWKAKYYPDEDHASVPVIAMYDGLKFIFNKYRFPTNKYMDASIPAETLRKMILKHYEEISKDQGYPVKPSEVVFNNMGYFHQQQQHYEHAKMFFELNIHFYPESSNTYDSMGDLYNALKDTTHAIQNYEKALSLKFSNETNDKLKQLKSH